jgi:Mg2+ and Co2+ transporter CorA
MKLIYYDELTLIFLSLMSLCCLYVVVYLERTSQ